VNCRFKDIFNKTVWGWIIYDGGGVFVVGGGGNGERGGEVDRGVMFYSGVRVIHKEGSISFFKVVASCNGSSNSCISISSFFYISYGGSIFINSV
jgi:hypothetical protein